MTKTPFGLAIRRQTRGLRKALLAGCLSLLTLQQFGHCAREVLENLLFTAGLSSAHAISTADEDAKGPALATDHLAPICEAVLTERKLLIRSSANPSKSVLPRTPDIFHNNCRPVLLRSRAIYCDFTRLRHILHPHFSLNVHTTSVLC